MAEPSLVDFYNKHWNEILYFRHGIFVEWKQIVDPKYGKNRSGVEHATDNNNYLDPKRRYRNKARDDDDEEYAGPVDESALPDPLKTKPQTEEEALQHIRFDALCFARRLFNEVKHAVRDYVFGDSARDAKTEAEKLECRAINEDFQQKFVGEYEKLGAHSWLNHVESLLTPTTLLWRTFTKSVEQALNSKYHEERVEKCLSEAANMSRNIVKKALGRRRKEPTITQVLAVVCDHVPRRDIARVLKLSKPAMGFVPSPTHLIEFVRESAKGVGGMFCKHPTKTQSYLAHYMPYDAEMFINDENLLFNPVNNSPLHLRLKTQIQNPQLECVADLLVSMPTLIPLLERAIETRDVLERRFKKQDVLPETISTLFKHLKTLASPQELTPSHTTPSTTGSSSTVDVDFLAAALEQSSISEDDFRVRCVEVCKALLQGAEPTAQIVSDCTAFFRRIYAFCFKNWPETRHDATKVASGGFNKQNVIRGIESVFAVAANLFRTKRFAQENPDHKLSSHIIWQSRSPGLAEAQQLCREIDSSTPFTAQDLLDAASLLTKSADQVARNDPGAVLFWIWAPWWFGLLREHASGGLPTSFVRSEIERGLNVGNWQPGGDSGSSRGRGRGRGRGTWISGRGANEAGRGSPHYPQSAPGSHGDGGWKPRGSNRGNSAPRGYSRGQRGRGNAPRGGGQPPRGARGAPRSE